MNILPKSSKEFARKEYWDQFFTKRSKSFEWYGNYNDLRSTISRYVKLSDNILVVGCGNSRLSVDLYDDGYHQNTSIDISEVVIKKMISKYQSNNMRPEMVFEVMDIFNMQYEDEQFNVILDKGTLDALSSDNLKLDKMFDEISRTLIPLGRYVCISLLQENVLQNLLNYFVKSKTWIIRIHRCRIISSEISPSDSVNLPVFIVILTKLKSSMNTTIDIDIHGEGKFHKCEDVHEVQQIVDSAQKFEFLKYHIRTNGKLEDDNFHIELFGDQTSTISRYQLFFVQKTSISTSSATKCATFIVPQGREHEWLFSTNKGRQNLLKQCQVDRLIVVHLSRKHVYESMEHIKNELGSQVTDFFPINLTKKINFLSLGDDIGERKTCFESTSEFSGQFIVEDVTVDDQKFRRLVFLDNRNVIQSEAKLKIIKSKNRKNKNTKLIETIDTEYLSCEHHKVMAANLSLTHSTKPMTLLLIGLGGGCFIKFMSENLPPNCHLTITVVEIDQTMYDIAQKWFQFQTKVKQNIHIEVIIDDGLHYISEQAKINRQFDFIIFDVDSKNYSLGVSCPPIEFVQESFLQQVRLCLTENGTFMLNLVARNEEEKQRIYQRLSSLFNQCLLFAVEEDLNEILHCTNFPQMEYLQLKDSSQRHNYLSKSTLYMPILAETYKYLCEKKPHLLSL